MQNPFGKSQPQNPDYEYFVIFDTKVGTFREPMLAINRHDILRELTSFFTDPKQQRNHLVTNSEDFALFKIGEYSKKTGNITPCQQEHIANLHELRSAALRQFERAAPRQENDAQPLGIVPT